MVCRSWARAPAITTVSGPIGGGGTTFSLAASNVELPASPSPAKATTRPIGTTRLSTSAASPIQGLAVTGTLIHDNLITGNRTGIDINNSNGHTIHNNVIDYNRTGMIFRNQTDNCWSTENAITNNWTVGVLFLDAQRRHQQPRRRRR